MQPQAVCVQLHVKCPGRPEGRHAPGLSIMLDQGSTIAMNPNHGGLTIMMSPRCDWCPSSIVLILALYVGLCAW